MQFNENYTDGIVSDIHDSPDIHTKCFLKTKCLNPANFKIQNFKDACRALKVNLSCVLLTVAPGKYLNRHAKNR